MTTVITERLCEHCGGPMPPDKRSNARTCSDRCRKLAYQARQGKAVPFRSVPQKAQLATVTAIRTDKAPTWAPLGEPRHAHQTAERCPVCGDPLIAGRRGTWRVCLACRKSAIPATVTAQYTRGDGAAVRQVISSRERDLASIALAKRKGAMLAQLGALAADDRIDPACLPVVEWFAAQTAAAKNAARLDELASLLPDAGIRRRHFWQGQPATIGAGTTDGPDGQDDDGMPGEDDDAPAPARLAIAPPVPRADMTWEGALDVLGWRASPSPGTCQIIDGRARCGTETRHHVGKHRGADTWVCDPHYQALSRAINHHERDRRTA